ncbi:MAG: hypothetical protein JJU30_11470 [Alkalimonas sp.]|nr:hypothetical protein [Alkalimonas sp.]
MIKMVLLSIWLQTPLDCFDSAEVQTDFSVSAQGVIRREAQHGVPLPTAVVVADLSDSGWLFSSQHTVARTVLPVTAVAGQRHFEQLILLAYDPAQQAEQLLAVRLFHQQSSPWYFSDLRPYLDDDTFAADDAIIATRWLEFQLAAGWWLPLAGRAMQLPELYGGILHLPVVTPSSFDDCPEPPLDLVVHFIHMHSGHSTASSQQLTLSESAPLQWHLKPHGEVLELWLHQAEQLWLLQPELQQILPDCLDCTETISDTAWPKYRPLAHFWLEQGVW